MAINKSDRARQFLPFDALKGLQEALREKERELEEEERKELSEEQCEIISMLLNKLEIGIKIKLRYYKNKQYINYEGIVSKIDSKSKLKPTRWAVQREFQETIFNGSKCKMTH